ncbi:Sperm-associated antigen 7 -like protein [Channa argus]|uniref:Sperm-associated antigen 7-like protein n=1 Tax=Channa argus TaxID=215402 RepID=A0A6G1QV25_CHAAH|nr:Sperm-associated antigen 7 -like protein [Channa argus]
MADLLGTILNAMEKPPTVGDQESRRKAREQAARIKKMEEDERRKKAEFRKQEQAALEEAASSETKKPDTCPNSNYRDKYSQLIGTSAAKDAAHTLEANSAYGCVPVANKRDTRSIEEAMNEIRAKKRHKQDDTGAHSSSS